jgi:hypothetical protein
MSKKIAQRLQYNAERAAVLRGIGTAVVFTKDDGTTVDTVLESEPWQLRHGQWVCKIRGVSGGVDCARLALDYMVDFKKHGRTPDGLRNWAEAILTRPELRCSYTECVLKSAAQEMERMQNAGFELVDALKQALAVINECDPDTATIYGAEIRGALAKAAEVQFVPTKSANS